VGSKSGVRYPEVSDALRAWLAAKGCSQANFVRALEDEGLAGITDSLFSNWVTGKAFPKKESPQRKILFVVLKREWEPGCPAENGEAFVKSLQSFSELPKKRASQEMLSRWMAEAPDYARSVVQQSVAQHDAARATEMAEAFLAHTASRRLGRLDPQPIDQNRKGDDRPATYDGWRESAAWAGRQDRIAEILADAALFNRLLTTPHGPSVTVVLGEPGAGKSILLESWFARTMRDTKSPGEAVFLRLADLGRGYEPPARSEAFATDILAVARGRPAGGIADPPLPEEPTVWLLDGLDEVDARAFLPAAAALPGRVIVSCRTAVWQSFSSELTRRAGSGDRFELQPLTPQEQVAYLADLERPDHPRWPRDEAEALIQRIRGNPQMRDVAGSPLVLDLIAEIGAALDLPASRAELFRRGLQAYWNRRLPECSAVRRFLDEREAILGRLAAAMLPKEIGQAWALAARYKSLRAAIRDEGEGANEAAWLKAFEGSGILTFNENRGEVGFAHLTFQEFALATHWSTLYGGDRALNFKRALDHHWQDPKAEETVALLLAMTVDEGDAKGVDGVLTDFVVDWLKTHRKNPKVLWEIGRSPLRTVLHLVSRSGVPLSALPKLDAEMTNLIGGKLLSAAIVGDPMIPDDILRWLSENVDHDDLRKVAMNPSMPRGVLRDLASTDVRWAVAWNPAAPADVLRDLAKHKDMRVPLCVARNPSTPADVLRDLAKHEEIGIRSAVAANPSTPADVLRSLSKDDNKAIQLSVVANPSIPADVLEHIVWELPAVARSSTDAKFLLRGWIRDKKVYARSAVARNPLTPPDVLQDLAKDKEMEVRQKVAANPSTPEDVLRDLASTNVRDAVAANPSTLEDVLRDLAKHEEIGIRSAVAGNPSTPEDVLWDLAKTNLRASVACNPSTPANVLRHLAEDKDAGVRSAVAANPSTPADVLEVLAITKLQDIIKNQPNFLLESVIVASGPPEADEDA